MLCISKAQPELTVLSAFPQQLQWLFFSISPMQRPVHPANCSPFGRIKADVAGGCTGNAARFTLKSA